MSVRWMSYVWGNGPEKQGHLLVMLALADFANDEGECWPSMKSIAQKSRMLERSAQRVIRQLEADGWLEIVTGKGRHGCNQYRINPVRKTPSESHPDNKTPRLSMQKPRPKRQETPSHGTPEPLEPSLEPSVTPESPTDILCKIVRPETARDFAAHRKAMKHPLTDVAAIRLVKKLADHPDPDAVFDLSIENGWRGVFPEKITGGQNGPRSINQPVRSSLADEIADAARAR